MSEKKDHTHLIEKHIRKLGSELNSDPDNDDYLYALAIEYASENQGEYFLCLPGIILPLFS